MAHNRHQNLIRADVRFGSRVLDEMDEVQKQIDAIVEQVQSEKN